jgi:hypothetical protein
VITEAGLECLRRVAPGHVDVVRAFLIDQLTRAELESMTTALRKTEQALRR